MTDSDDGPPTYLESNKPEAERCVELASAAWKAGDLQKAHRMLQKSLKLYPTSQAQQLIMKLTQHVKEQSEAQERREEQQQREQHQQRQRQQQQQQQSSHQSSSHHSSSNSSSGAYQRPSASSSSSQSTPKPTPPSPSPSKDSGAAFTQDQSQAARTIIALRKDYYALFSVHKGATDQEIKSSYRKLALKFHPDKNKAPEAEEAFKVVSAAFQCLSDPQKRAAYDEYGHDDTGMRAQQQQQRQQYHRDEDLSPEDVFNMFFNGGMNMGGGIPRRTYTYRRQARPQHQPRDESGPAAFFSQFAHFLPLILLLLFGLLSTPSSEEQIFGLEKSATFPVQRSTAHAKVDYFVNNQFQYRFQRDIRALAQVESLVESQAFKKLEEDCQWQKRQASDRERQIKKDAKGSELARKLQELHAKPMEACEKLNQYQMNAHGAARGG